jgi:transcriptional regulator with XRE-family HTH domain
MTAYTVTMVDQTFGEWLRAKRQEHGLTQQTVAVAVKASESIIGKWERGKVTPLPRTEDLVRAYIAALERKAARKG